MKLVQKGNKQLKVRDDQLANYVTRGYAEIDQKTGKPVAKEPVDEVKVLKKENAALKKTNKELAEKLAVLNDSQDAQE